MVIGMVSIVFVLMVNFGFVLCGIVLDVLEFFMLKLLIIIERLL